MSTDEEYSAFDWQLAHARLDRIRDQMDRGGNLSEEEIGRILKQRALHYAKSAEEHDASAPVDVIVFSVGEHRFAVELANGAAAAPLNECTVVPGIPDFYLGLQTYRGSVYPIIDIRPLIGVDEEATVNFAYAVLSRDDGSAIGLAASEISGIIQYRSSEIAESKEETGRGLIMGVGPQNTAIIDMHRLLSDFRLIVDDQPDVVTVVSEGSS